MTDRMPLFSRSVLLFGCCVVCCLGNAQDAIFDAPGAAFGVAAENANSEDEAETDVDTSPMAK